MFKSAWIVSLFAVALAACSSSTPVRRAPAASTPVAVEEAPVVVAAPPPDEPPAPTPPEAVKPEQSAGGKYKVSVVSERTAKEAAPWVKKLEADGLRVATEPTEVGGVTWQRVVVPGLKNKAEAAQMVSYLEEALGIKGAWVVPKTAVAAAAPAAAPAATPAEAEAPPPAPIPAPAPAAAGPESKVPDTAHPKN